MPQFATAFNPTTKQRKKITVGDPNAFAGGFILETPTQNLQTYKAPSTNPAPVVPEINNQANNQPNYNELANKLGMAGLTLADLKGLIPTEPTAAEKADIYKNTGVTDLENQAFALPSQPTESLYNAKYSELGLQDIKSRIDALTTDYKAKKDALNQAIGQEGENPWLPESSRVGRVKRLQELASGDIGNLEEQINNLQSLYNSGIGELNNYVSRASADFSANQQINQTKLNYLLQKAQGQISDLATSKAQQAYRYIPDYLTGVAATKKTSQDNEMALKGYEYIPTPKARDEWIKQGGQVIQISGGTYKVPQTAIKKTTPTNPKATPENNYPTGFSAAVKNGIALLEKGEPWGTVWNQIKMQFPKVADADIDKALGTQWSKPGAFEEWKQKQFKQTNPTVSQQQAGVWMWLASPEAQAMDNATKKQEIMANGFDPQDFGIY